jgi:hypothetical protein
MGAVVKLVDNRTAEQRVADWLASADDAVLACRGQGHRWPKLIRPGKLPKGITAKIADPKEGQVELVAMCPDCRKSRRMITLPAGEVSFPEVKWRAYKEDPAGRYKAPPGVRITPSQARNETYRRFSEAILAQARAQMRTVPGETA